MFSALIDHLAYSQGVYPSSDFMVDGQSMLGWCQTQRNKKDSMASERRKKLDSIQFVWDPYSKSWEDGFKQLEIFIERTGHGRVPDKFVQNGYRLGQWVGVQRSNKDQMSSDRRERLDAIGFVWSAK